MRASIVGGSGYAGGELLRLLLWHPEIEVGQVTSESMAGEYIYAVHPNLRGHTKLKFNLSKELEPADILFLALPHGEAQKRNDEYAGQAGRIIDLAGDFRLHDPALYERWYGHPHGAPAWLGKFVYGLPELHREDLRGASYASGVGCNATAVNLAVYPLFLADVVDRARGVVVEVKGGSSEGGNKPSADSHHPVRADVVRSYAPVGHRHSAEVIQEMALGKEPPAVHLSATALGTVRGVLSTCHLFLKQPLSEKDLWKVFRQAYGNEPFVRIVKERRGNYRYPEPKILAGSNYAEVGFALDEESGRVVALCAIDNLMKGAAGTAVQAMNLMCGWDEKDGLGFPGLHPI